MVSTKVGYPGASEDAGPCTISYFRVATVLDSLSTTWNFIDRPVEGFSAKWSHTFAQRFTFCRKADEANQTYNFSTARFASKSYAFS